MNPTPATAHPVDRSQHRLLIVNDDPVGRYTTVRQLQAAGFPTLEAGTGMEALALADEKLSLIVLDIHLPDIDGLEVCRRLRAQPATFRLPVIHLTAAFLTDEDKVRGLDSGADAYLTHPVEPAVLISTILALVRTRKAEDGMRHSEAKFRAAFERAPGGIALVDAESGRMLEVNPAMLALFGRPQGEVVGHPLLDFVASSDLPAARSLVSSLPAAGGQGEFRLVRPGGEQTPIEWTSVPYVEPNVAMLIGTDISQRQLVAQQRQALLDRERTARGDAERHNRQKDDLIAVLSHELRNPLNVILNTVHVLQRARTPEMLERGLLTIQRNATLQARLISETLDMSRMNLGKLPLKREWTEIGTVIAEAVSAMQPQLLASHHRLRLNLADETFRIYADAARLHQVLWNLLGNAAKFSPPNSEITLSVRADGQGVRLAVRDEGQGIAPDLLPHVFDRFVQGGKASTRLQGGMGLGLSLVKSLVEGHGGHVTAQSDGTGQGAEFSVWLPGGAGEAFMGEGKALASLRDVAESRSASAAQPQPPHLLLVEDDMEAGALLVMILGDHGMRVTHVASVDEALRQLEVQRFDALVSDIGLQGRDGYELVRELRRREGRGPKLPAIALTAFSRDVDRDQAIAAGFDLHLGKPLQPQQLVDQIEQFLSATGPDDE